MIPVIVNLAILTTATILCEYFWKTRKISSEGARKLMHILGGVFVAFWPLYLSWREIQILFIISAFAIVFLRFTGLIKSLFAVKRKTIGEILVLVTIGALVLFEPPIVLFTLVVLQIALADGLAALIGNKFGKSNSYKIFGYDKSVAGTVTCLIISFLIVLMVYISGQFSGTVPLLALIIIPLAVTLVENLGVYGIDNTLIAITVGVLGKYFNFY